MNGWRLTLVWLGCALVLGACAAGPDIVQGRVEQYERSTHLLRLRDELNPERVLEVSLVGADIGAEPVLGDTLRIAYRSRNGRLVATRVMNVTRQEEIGRKPARGQSPAH